MKIKILNDLAKIPTYGSEGAAGADLYAATESDILIRPHETVKIETGIAMEIPNNAFGAIFARSGLATKQGLRPSNCVGVIDPDYRGEIIVALHNDTEEEQIVPAGSRIAQFILMPKSIHLDFEIVEELGNTERGDGGFGSTGIQ